MIIVYDKSTGEILQNIAAVDADAALYETPSRGVILATEARLDTEWYYDTAQGQFIAIPAQPSKFHVWNSATKTWNPQLSRAKRARLSDALKEYRSRKELPIIYDAKTLDTDNEAREQLMFKALEFAERVRLKQPANAAARVWENADGTFHTFATDNGFRNWLGGFVITISERVAQQRLVLRMHVQNIRALTTVEAVLAYDITTGWPT